MIPILSESQQIIRASLRRHGDLTVEEVSAVSGLDVERDLRELERKGCVESAGGDRWRLCDTWAARIIVTEEGVRIKRPSYPLWTRDAPPTDDAWVKMDCGERWDGMSEGFHTGGPWLHTETGEVWKPLDGRPYPNATESYATDEHAALVALAGRPGFPHNWRVETTTQRKDGEAVERRWLVRPRCLVLGKDWEKRYLKIEDVLAVEQAIRAMNAAGWLLNDPISLALDPLLYEPFILDLSISGFTRVEPGYYGVNDLQRIERWFEWLGLDQLVELRQAARDVLPAHPMRCHEMMERGEWPGKEWQHVYASRNRPITSLWANIPDAHYVHVNYSDHRVHTWVVVPEPLSEKKIYDYELTWGWSPLTLGEPAPPVFWWETTKEEVCQQLSLL